MEQENLGLKEAQDITLSFLAKIDNEVKELKKELWGITNKWHGEDCDLSKCIVSSVNLIEQIEKHYGEIPADTTLGKVNWIKENIGMKREFDGGLI